MAYIFASGTKYAALISALAISAIPTAINAADSSSPASNHIITIQIDNLRSQRGQILVCLTSNARAFPDCSKDANSVRMAVRAADAQHFTATAPRAGNYAIAVVHDENSNNKMDKAIFLPKEGFGFSRNPTITTGPPRFTAASFAVNGPQSQRIKMRYML
jgi:uncharacterized protein (DUF2141 family)